MGKEFSVYRCQFSVKTVEESKQENCEWPLMHDWHGRLAFARCPWHPTPIRKEEGIEASRKEEMREWMLLHDWHGRLANACCPWHPANEIEIRIIIKRKNFLHGGYGGHREEVYEK